MPAAKVIPSGIEQRLSDQAEFCHKAREIGHFIEEHLKNFFLDLIQQQAYALERLEEWTPTERLLTLKEAAAYLHYRPRTIDSYTSPGKPPLIKFSLIGGEKRFKKIWLDEAVERGVVQPRGVVKL